MLFVQYFHEFLLRNLQFCDIPRGILGKTPQNMKGNTLNKSYQIAYLGHRVPLDGGRVLMGHVVG